jgi:ribonuclease BN (tRNA processing enzyme)
MRLIIVGCGDAFASGGHGAACFRLDAGGMVAALDFGAGALVGWRRLGFSPSEIDLVAVSHLHGDHFGGLPFLLIERQYGGGPPRPLTLIGPPGLRDRLEAVTQALYPRVGPRQWSFALDIREIAPGGATRAGALRVSATEVDHPSGAPSLGLRVSSGGKKIAYSGDTAWTPTLVELARGADLLLIECSGAREPVPHHLDWETLRAHLPALRARRIVLTHMSEAARALAEEMRGHGVELADEGLVFDL